jgi:glycosyltransferase involved in cell wall biosynthesis
MKNISAVLITKNAEATINLTLASLQEFSEVVVLDTGSTDRTLEICKRYNNVEIYRTGFTGFGKAKNKASELAKNDWILSIDADEVISKELLASIKKEVFKPNTVYKWKRENYYREKRVKYSGWGKEFVTRLYNKRQTSFNQKLVHESVRTDKMKIKALKGHLIHYSYLSISDFAIKRDFYSELFALEYKGKRKSNPFTAFLKSVFNFFNTFFVQLACLDGYRGLLIAISNANVTFMKYLKLYEANLGYDIKKYGTLLHDKETEDNFIIKQSLKEQEKTINDNSKILKGFENVKAITTILN